MSRKVKGRKWVCRRGDNEPRVILGEYDDYQSYVSECTPYINKNPEQPLEWWKAQCVFCGLPDKQSLVQLKAAIKKHKDKGIDPALQEVFDELRKEFDEVLWPKLNDDQKASTVPGRFLDEIFGFDSERGDQVIIISIPFNYHTDVLAVIRERGLS